MTFRIAVAVRNARADAIRTALDAGSGGGTLKIYTGSQPATADTAASGTLLGTLTLEDPAAPSASGGVLTLDVSPVPTVAAVASGTAGWARLADSSGATVADGSVTATGGGGDFTITSTAVTSGQTINLTGGTITEPA